MSQKHLCISHTSPHYFANDGKWHRHQGIQRVRNQWVEMAQRSRASQQQLLPRGTLWLREFQNNWGEGTQSIRFSAIAGGVLDCWFKEITRTFAQKQVPLGLPRSLDAVPLRDHLGQGTRSDEGWVVQTNCPLSYLHQFTGLCEEHVHWKLVQTRQNGGLSRARERSA